MSHPKIAVTMGDPAGVGPEICLELLGNQRVSEHCVPIVFGDADVLSRCAEKTGKLKQYKEITRAELNIADAPSVLSLDGIDIDELTPGSVSEATGHASYRYLESAITACRMSEVDAVTITEDRYLADYFESVVDYSGNAKASLNVVLSEVLRILNEKSISIQEFSITPQRLSELIKLKEEDKINSSAMQTIFNKMLEDEGSPEDLAKSMNLIQVSDSGFLEELVDDIIANNPDEVERFKAGKKQLMGFFVGQAMKASKGKANPKMVTQMVTKKLEA